MLSLNKAKGSDCRCSWTRKEINIDNILFLQCYFCVKKETESKKFSEVSLCKSLHYTILLSFYLNSFRNVDWFIA
jgi:hypothetical protein